MFRNVRRMPIAAEEEKKDAYMTTEASLLLPMVIALIVFIMFLAFYLYSVCFLNQAAYIAALRGSQTLDGNAQTTAEQALEELLEGRIIPIKGLNKEIKASALSVEVNLDAELALPLTGILPIRKPLWQIHVEKKSAIRNAAGYIRLMRRI